MFHTQQRESNQYILDAALAVKNEIDSHPCLKKNVSDLINDAGIGRNSLQHQFKKLTGKTITRYRLEKRMQAAMELLEESRLTIKQVSIRCGYKRPDRFSKDFKKIYKESASGFLNGNKTK